MKLFLPSGDDHVSNDKDMHVTSDEMIHEVMWERLCFILGNLFISPQIKRPFLVPNPTSKGRQNVNRVSVFA
jgi:hypothetical protein